MCVWFIAQTMVALCMATGAQGLSVAYLLVGLLHFKYNSCIFFFFWSPSLYLISDYTIKVNSCRNRRKADIQWSWLIWKGLIRSSPSQQSKARGHCMAFFSWLECALISHRVSPITWRTQCSNAREAVFFWLLCVSKSILLNYKNMMMSVIW